MLRALMLAFALASTPALVDDAYAGKPTEEQLDLMKAESEWARETAKAVEKLYEDWEKNRDKEKDNSEVEKELKTYYKNELARLRDLGVETVDEDLPVHPKHPEQAIPDEDEQDRDKMYALRDLMVELKKGELKPKDYRAKLKEYVQLLNQRAERKEKFYEKEKEKA